MDDRAVAVDRVALLSLHSSPLAQLGSSDAGGMNLYVRRLAGDLRGLGVRADIFTRRTDPDAPQIVTTEMGARVIHLDAGPPRQLPKSVLPLHLDAMVAAFEEFARRDGGRYDVLHSHYWLSGLAALALRASFQVPIVHMFHTLSRVKEFYVGAPDPTDSALRSDGERRVIEGADVLVGATEAERGYMERLYGCQPGVFAVIPPGVDAHTFHPLDREASRQALSIRASRVVLYVGRFDRIKGLDVLLQAMSELAPRLRERVTLILVGGREESAPYGSARYRRMVDRLGLSDVVDFRGTVSQNQLPLFYSAADISAMPSSYESFGMAALESMACGTPVVAFRTGGPATIIEHGRTGFLVPPGRRQDFSATLYDALTWWDLEGMGRQARFVAQGYTWATVAQKTLDLYRSALCLGAASAPAVRRS